MVDGAVSVDALVRVVFLIDYNTRLVVLSTALLGTACGLAGTFLLLRKRSLMGDALSHATLPGICLAFMVMVAVGGNGKWLPGLLLGALVSGIIGYLCVIGIRRITPIKDDAAMGIVLSVFFGVGVMLIGLIQQMPQGSAAGLESFIYGKTASLVFSDLVLLATLATVALLCCVLLFKELRLLCFDETFAAAQGLPVFWLDVALLTVVALMTVAGLQAVGLVLIIAFLILPAAAARFWTEQTATMLWLAAGLGGAGGWIGASVSALMPGLPAGSIIVLVSALLFTISLVFGSSRGVMQRLLRRRRLRHRIHQQHLLRSAYEWLEVTGQLNTATATNLPLAELEAQRTWSHAAFQQCLHRCEAEGWIEPSEPYYRLTGAGFERAQRITRNHRLWEIYLIEHADVAASHVDRDADAVEHVLGETLVSELEQQLWKQQNPNVGESMPPSPHT